MCVSLAHNGVLDSAKSGKYSTASTVDDDGIVVLHDELAGDFLFLFVGVCLCACSCNNFGIDLVHHSPMYCRRIPFELLTSSPWIILRTVKPLVGKVGASGACHWNSTDKAKAMPASELRTERTH